MSWFTWLFKDEAEVIKERLDQADRDNRALEKNLDSLKQRVLSLESQLRDLSLAQVYQDGMIERLTPNLGSQKPVIRKRESKQTMGLSSPGHAYTPYEGGPDLPTGMLVAQMALSGGWDSSSSSYDSSSSSSDSGSSGGGE